MRYIAVLFVLMLVAGCATHTPFLTDMNDSALTIHANIDVPQAEIDALAIKGCKPYGKKPSKPLSEHRLRGELFTRVILYACK